MELLLLHVTEQTEPAAADSLDFGVGDYHAAGGVTNRYL